jgi:hypothetical protein
MSQRIKPLPMEALGISGITPIDREQNKESDKSGDNSNTQQKERRTFKTPPKLVEELVYNQPDKLTSLEESQIKIDALKKVIADAVERRAKEEAKERSEINKWALDRRIDAIIKEAEAKAKGGNKKVKDKYTVKELKAIASRNNIKITKKLNGKTVPLNKKGLFAKLKRNKVI